MPRIIVKFQDTIVQTYEIEKSSVRIGRRPGNDIRIDNLAVSGNHAKIEKVNDSYIIIDLKSTNGTYVNDKKIVQAKLNHKDQITIGKHTLIFEEEPEDTTAKGLTKENERLLTPEARQPTVDMPRGARLRFMEPKGMEDFPLKKKLVIIGKSETADLRLRGLFDPKIAAVIARRPDGYSLLPEQKGRVKLNGVAILERVDLKEGDVIEIGHFKIEFSQK